MKLLSFSSTLLSIAAAVSGVTIDGVDVGDAEKLGLDGAPGRYIVQVASQKPANTVQSFAAMGYDVQVQYDYDSSVFTGLSFQVTNSNSTTLEDIQNLDWVEQAWQASVITLEFDPETVSESAWDTHSITGVDKLHDEGKYGQDIVIGVIDTGVDYTHPAFNGGLGEGSIIGGYDFMVDDLTQPGDDPMDCNGHGTFVSSIIAANSDTTVGVAPGAKIKMYKVFGCSGSTTEDYIIAGMLKALEDGVDVLSLSLGSDRGYRNGPLSVVGAAIAKSMPVLFSAGNSGSYGSFRASNGASGEGVIAVGSAQAASLVGYPAIAKASNGDEYYFAYVPENGKRFSTNGSFEVDWTDNICFGEFSTSNSARVIMGNRGLCSTEYALGYLESGGYQIALPVSDELFYAGFGIPSFYTLKLVGFVNSTIGSWVQSQIDAGNTVKIEFNSASLPESVENTRVTGGQIDYFTSWGPTFNNNFYPHVTAPGGHVLGAAVGGGWYIASGTSFSCPYLAGVLALYMEQNPGTDLDVLRNKVIGATNLMARLVDSHTDEADFSLLDESNRAPLIQQGAGLIDAYALLEKKVRIISSPYLELNDTDNRVTHFDVSFINEDSSEATFLISHTVIKGIQSRDASDLHIHGYYPPDSDAAASVEFGQTEITLGAGETATFSVDITPPDVDDSTAPIFMGTIDITGSNGESVRVPYMGMVASTYNWTPFISAPLSIRQDADGSYHGLLDPADYLFDPSRLDSPITYFKIRFGTEFYSFDIVDADYDVNTYVHPPTPGENGYLGPVMVQPDLYGNNGTFPVEFASTFTSYAIFGFQSFANGTKIPSGKYKLFARALRMFGKKENLEDWEFYFSNEFNVALNGVVAGESSLIESSSSELSVESSADSSEYASESSSQVSIEFSISAEVTSSSEVESSTASSEPSETVEDGDLPTASPYRNDAVPTGIDIITNITAYSKVSGTKDINKDDVITVSVSFEYNDYIPAGTTTQFTAPGIFYGDLSSSYAIRLSDYTGNAVATLKNDQSTNVWTITFDTAWGTRYNHIWGTITYNVRLQYSDDETEVTKRDATETVDLSSPVIVPVVFVTPNDEFTSYLHYNPYPTYMPYKVLTVVDANPTWDIYIPGSVGAWDSVTITSSKYSYYAFDCSQMSAVVGTEKDEFGILTSGEGATGFANTCTTDSLSATLTGGIATDEIFKFLMVAQRTQLFYIYWQNTAAVTINFSNGTSSTYSLYSYVLAQSVGTGTTSSFSGEVLAVEESSAAESSAVESSVVESSAVESSAIESSAVESSVVESSAEASSSAVESSAVESSADVTSAAESSADVTSAAESSADVTSAVESSAVESSAVGSSAVASSAVESSAVQSSAVESSAVESSAVASSAVESSAVASSAVASSAVASSAVASSAVESSAVESSAVESSAVESSAVESSAVASSAVESSAVESSAVESSAVASSAVESSAVESSAVESSAVASSAVESSTVEPSAIESSAVESSAVESSAVESSAVESSADVTSAVESSAVESSAIESSAVESSAVESSAESSSSADVTTAAESSAAESSGEVASSVVESSAISSGFTGSSEVSYSSTSSESASPSDSGLPRLSEQRNPRTPNGLDIITNIEIFDVVSNSPDDVHPDHLLRIAVSIVSTQPIDNDSTQFTIPGIFYDFVSSFELYSAEGDYVATVSGDEATNVFTVNFDSEWARTHRNIRGTFSFDVRLSYTVTAIQKRAIDTLTLTGPSVVAVVFVTPGEEFATTLTITSVDAETPAASVGTGETSVFEGDLISSSSGASGATTATGTTTGATGATTDATSATGATTGTITNTERTVVTVTSCSQGVCSEVLSTVSPTSTSPQTTVVTITSCSNNACSTSVTTGFVTTVSTTVNGVETVYTTYCPTETGSDAATKQTVTLTVTSCSENKCVTSTFEAILSTATTTMNGHETVYTTYVPVSTTTVNKTSTAKNTEAAITTTANQGATTFDTSALKSALSLVVDTKVTVNTAATAATEATAATSVTVVTGTASVATSGATSSTSSGAPVVTNNENSGMTLATNSLVFLLSFFAFIF